MGNRKRYAKFQENLFNNNEIKLIFCPPLFRKRPILRSCLTVRFGGYSIEPGVGPSSVLP